MSVDIVHTSLNAFASVRLYSRDSHGQGAVEEECRCQPHQVAGNHQCHHNGQQPPAEVEDGGEASIGAV